MANPRKDAFIQAIRDTVDKDEKTTYQALEAANQNLRFYESIDGAAIYTAIKCENEWAVKWLCQHFKEAFPNDDKGWSPLERAVEYKDLGRVSSSIPDEKKEALSPHIKKRREIVAAIYQHKPPTDWGAFDRAFRFDNFYFLDEYDKNHAHIAWALKQAIIDNNMDAIKQLHELKKMDLIAKGPCPKIDDEDFLTHCIGEGKIEIAVYLIEQGFLRAMRNARFSGDKMSQYFSMIFNSRTLNKNDFFRLFNALTALRTDGIAHRLEPHVITRIYYQHHLSDAEKINVALKIIPLMDFHHHEDEASNQIWNAMQHMNNEEVFISFLLQVINHPPSDRWGHPDTHLAEQYIAMYRERFEVLVATGQLDYVKRLHRNNIMFPLGNIQYHPAANTQGMDEYLRGRQLIKQAGDPNLRLAPDQAARHLEQMNPADAIDLLDACLACNEMTAELYERLHNYIKPFEIPPPPPAPVVRFDDPTLSAFAERKQTFFGDPGDSKQQVPSEKEMLQQLRQLAAHDDLWKDNKTLQEMLKDFVASKTNVKEPRG